MLNELQNTTLGEWLKVALWVGGAFGGFLAAYRASKQTKSIDAMKTEIKQDLATTFPDKSTFRETVGALNGKVDGLTNDVRQVRHEQALGAENMIQVRRSIGNLDEKVTDLDKKQNKMSDKVDSVERGQAWIGSEVKELEKIIKKANGDE